MLSAIAAESAKLRRHRATWLLVWIFPLGALLLPLIAILVQLGQGRPPAPAALELSQWLENAAAFWNGPQSSLVRFLICAFTALVFAGEYGWNTWKLIVPHRSRTTLIAAKYAVTVALLYVAFIAAALIWMALSWLADVALGDPLPAGITAAALFDVHWRGFLAGLPSVLFTVAFTSLAAILTRSTVAALVIGLVVITLEGLFVAFAPMIAIVLPGVVEPLYQLLPGYHLSNLASWALRGAAQSVAFTSGTVVAYDWSASAITIAGWILVLVVLTFWRFRKQDIN